MTETARARQTVCLNMIVRDDSQVLRECIASVSRFIDYWVIVDTGSEDDTPDLVSHLLSDIPGELHHRDWVNFGENRTQALELARGKSDFVLFMDADNVLCAPAGWVLPRLVADAYWLRVSLAGLDYQLPLLVRSDLKWAWKGAVHEYLSLDDDFTKEALTGVHVEARQAGLRSRDPNTYLKDAQILLSELQRDPGNCRTAFYLAQSWQSAGQPQAALQGYQQRIAMGGWEQEVFISLYRIGAILHSEGKWDDAERAYEEAWSYRPERIEPLYEICRHYREKGMYAKGYRVGVRALNTGCATNDILFVQSSIYRWQLAYEAALCAFNVSEFAHCQKLCDLCLETAEVPTHEANILRELATKAKSVGKGGMKGAGPGVIDD